MDGVAGNGHAPACSGATQVRFEWTVPERNDVVRLYLFWLKKNEQAAANVVQSLVNAPGTLLLNPRRGEVVGGYEPREMRRAIIGSYEMHYELQGDVLIILRIWHQREDR